LLSNEFSLSEYTKIDVGWGFAPDPTGGVYRVPKTPLLVSKGPLPAGGEWRGGERRTRVWGKEGKRGERGNGEGRGKGGMGKRGEKGEVEGIAPWLLEG